ncbi:response regulator transcription factor [Mesorhizobium sp. M8A.F.Ca.ET.173.01.1.1]|nr:response regulator transcription factor [Mesorhizobium sp. M8A.F.Ca.ET.173.01.1.1]
MISVVVVDDHQLFRQGIITLLNETDDIRVVGDAGEVSDAVRKIKGRKPDVVIMDITLGHDNGIRVAQQLRGDGLVFGLVIVTMQTDASFFTQAKEEASVDGYVLKLDAFEELVKAVRAVAMGRKFVSPSLAAELVWSRGAAAEGAHLTRREIQVIAMVAEGLSSQEIGRILGISRRTVETYRANLREKLGLASNAAVVRYAIKQGIAKL